MIPVKLGLAYESCFGDPYRTASDRYADGPRGFAPPSSLPLSRAPLPSDGWLTSILRGAIHFDGAPTRSTPAVVVKKTERAASPPPSPLAAPSVRADVHVEVAVEEAPSSSESRSVTSPPPEVAHHARPASPSSPSTSVEEAHEASPSPVPVRKRLSTHSASAAPPPAEEEDALVATTGEGTREVGTDTGDVARNEAALAHEQAARLDHVVTQELRGGVVARAEEEDRLADVVDRLYDKIRLNAVQVVALDDLQYQLTQLRQIDASPVAAVNSRGGGGGGGTASAQTSPAPPPPSSSHTRQSPVHAVSTTTETAFDRQELALCLYGLREQVVQMKAALVKAEADQAAAQRARQKEAARSAKSGRRVRVDVVRAYDSPPQPRVKPPFQPVVIPPTRARRRLPDKHNNNNNNKSHNKSTSGGRSMMEFSLPSSMRSPMTRWSSVYHDGSTANFEMYSPGAEDEVVVRRRAGKSGRVRRPRRASSIETETVPSVASSSSVSLTASSSVSGSELTSSSSVDSSGSWSERRSTVQTASTSSSSSRSALSVAASPIDSSAGSRDTSPSPSASTEASTTSSRSARPRAGVKEENDDDDDSDASSTGADIFWRRRMEALKRKKAREASLAEGEMSASASAPSRRASSSVPVGSSSAPSTSSSSSSSARWGSSGDDL